MLEVTGYLRLD